MRLSRFWPAVPAVLLACSPALQADDDVVKLIRANLDKEKTKYTETVQQLKAGMVTQLEKVEKEARDAGNKKLLDQVKEQKEAFELREEMPRVLKTDKYLQDKKKALLALETAYVSAVKQLTKNGKDDEATAVEKEWTIEKDRLVTLASYDTADFLKPDNWEGRADIWKLGKRSIVGETTEDPKYNTFLCSKKKYGDFELKFKVTLRDEVGNSGVQIRSARIDKDGDPKPFRVAGPQADIGKDYWGSLYGEGVGGMMKAADKKTIEKVVKGKEANDYKIVAKGTKITIIINGETMVDDDFPKLPGKDMKDAPTEGIIAFQAHAGYPKMRVEFADIQFTDLSKKK